MDRRLFFYSLTIEYPHAVVVGTSCHLQQQVIYFSTERKLEKWKEQHKEDKLIAHFGMHEITVKCAKELVRLSKKKIRYRCGECGK